MKIWLGLAAFAIALLLRLSNAPAAFAGGVPEISPVDELYHLKRMTHFVELDPDRGVGAGAWCPWPPLYDRLAGGFARITGAKTQLEVLQRVVWIAPVVDALFVAFAVMWLDRRFGRTVALVAGAALAASPFVVTQAWIGSLDHHWTEPIFVVAIIVGIVERRTLLLAIALTAAMFVQTALLVAVALAFVVLFFTTEGREGAIAFGAGAIAIAIYRATRPPGYPDNAWFLGWTHAALFAGAAVACGYLAWRGSRLFALLAGACVVLAVPSAVPSLLQGTHFFGGETWLRTILEFQPLWAARGADLASILTGLGAGTLIVWLLAARAWRERDHVRGTLAFFAIVYLLLSVTSLRFWVIAIPLLAIAGALAADAIGRRWVRIAALTAVAVIPPVQFALWMQNLKPPVTEAWVPWLHAARFLQTQPPGRLLAAWSEGHLLDVIGQRAVVIDNFGTMPSEIVFDRAYDALLTRHEDSLARYCDASGIRFIVYEPPVGMPGAAVGIGVDPRFYAGTKLAFSTVWYRAYHNRPLRFFRRVYARDRLVIVERR